MRKGTDGYLAGDSLSWLEVLWNSAGSNSTPKHTLRVGRRKDGSSLGRFFGRSRIIPRFPLKPHPYPNDTRSKTPSLEWCLKPTKKVEFRGKPTKLVDAFSPHVPPVSRSPRSPVLGPQRPAETSQLSPSQSEALSSPQARRWAATWPGSQATPFFIFSCG